MTLFFNFLRINSLINESDLTEDDFHRLFEKRPVLKNRVALLEGNNQLIACNFAANKAHRFAPVHVKTLHKILYSGIDDATAGRFRTFNSVYGTANFEDIEHDLDEFCQKMNGLSSRGDLASVFAFISSDFLRISPFVNGNEQVSRFLCIPFFSRGRGFDFIREDMIEDYNWICSNPSYDGFLNLFRKVHVKKEKNKPKFSSNGAGKKLLKIGEIAVWSDTPVSKIRYWMNFGLFSPKEVKDKGMYLFDPRLVETINQIKKMQARGKDLVYIKNKLARSNED